MEKGLGRDPKREEQRQVGKDRETENQKDEAEIERDRERDLKTQKELSIDDR